MKNQLTARVVVPTATAFGAWWVSGRSIPASLGAAAGASLLHAYWEGAREEVVKFGRDSMATLLNWLRRCLHIAATPEPRAIDETSELLTPEAILTPPSEPTSVPFTPPSEPTAVT